MGQACCDSENLEMREGHGRGTLSRTIPPATRRAVLQRDGHKCQVPDCNNRLWLDIHHLEYFRDGGDHSEDNLITLCCTHHQLLHEGLLGLERDAGELVFRFGDGREVRRAHTARRGREGCVSSGSDSPYEHPPVPTPREAVAQQEPRVSGS